jgi:hypothetical protein
MSDPKCQQSVTVQSVLNDFVVGDHAYRFPYVIIYLEYNLTNDPVIKFTTMDSAPFDHSEEARRKFIGHLHKYYHTELIEYVVSR